MDDIERNRIEHRQKKYRELYGYDFSGTGIFVKKKRKQLLSIEAKSGGKTSSKNDRERKTIANFWYDVRENAKTGLIDLQLFAETVSDKDSNQVLNVDTLTPVIDAFLDRNKTDSARAMVAYMLIERSYQYLSALSHSYLMPAQERQIEDAINLAKQLTLLVLPQDKRGSFLLNGGRQP